MNVNQFLLLVAGALSVYQTGVAVGIELQDKMPQHEYFGYFGPEYKTSESFRSFIGHVDKRVELDSSIKHGHGSYYATLSMMASKLAYESRACIETIVNDHWKMEYLGAHDYWNDYTIVLSFRGTEAFDVDSWCADFDISWYKIKGVGKIHRSFMKGLGLQKNISWPKEIDMENNDCPAPLAYYAIRDTLRELQKKNDKAKYIITGHILGGALAILFPAVLIFHEEKLLLERLEGAYTFGQPRVGDKKFGEFMEVKLKEYGVGYFRCVYSNDMVPRLPYDPELYYKTLTSIIKFWLD